MRQVFDLAIQEQSLYDLLNDRKFDIEEIDVACSEKGYTTVLVRYSLSRMPIRKKWKRRIRRFILTDGNNEELNGVYLQSDYRIIEEFDFRTELGVIIVLHFEEKMY